MALQSDQQQVLSAILRIGRQRGATAKEIKAAIETGLVESGLRNLRGGDADSAGWRQERASLYKDPTNLHASINRFFDETAAVRGKYGRAGDLAAAVQRPAAQYRGRYQGVSAQADQLRGGRGASSSSRSGGDSSSTDTTTTTTTTTPGVDNRAARASLVSAFLDQKSADPVAFAMRARELRDVAPTSQSDVQTQHTSTAAPRHHQASSSGGSGVHGSKVLELIFNDGRKGYGIKDGADVDGGSVFSAVWAGHANHVHVAAGPQTVVALGRVAQDRFGLHVGENSHFGGVNPVHVPGSYHNKDEAIDVSGDPRKMAAFARYVRTYNRHQ